MGRNTVLVSDYYETPDSMSKCNTPVIYGVHALRPELRVSHPFFVFPEVVYFPQGFFPCLKVGIFLLGCQVKNPVYFLVLLDEDFECFFSSSSPRSSPIFSVIASNSLQSGLSNLWFSTSFLAFSTTLAEVSRTLTVLFPSLLEITWYGPFSTGNLSPCETP